MTFKSDSLIFIIILFISFHFGIKRGNAQFSTPETAIRKAVIIDKIKKNQNQLQTINDSLLSDLNRNDIPFNRYWLSYGLYNQAIIADQQSKKEKAEKLIDKSIQLLRFNKGDLESHALLAIQIGFSIRFKSYFSFMKLGRDSRFHAERALDLNPKNLRANLAFAINDFYTPKVFGGGKKVEQFLKMAIELPKDSNTESFPTWGKEQVYELLIKYYLQNKDSIIAKDYVDKGLLEFPKSQLLLSFKF